MVERTRRESVVRLGGRAPSAPRDPAAIVVCWFLLVLGVVLVPAACLFWALLTAGPVEYSGTHPPLSTESTVFLWIARIVASASAAGVLAITVVVTARGGRLINGWVVLVLAAPVVLLLWDLRPA